MRVEPHGLQRVAVTAATVLVLTLTFIASSAHGALIVDFMPEPASPGEAEFIWDGSSLTSGSGAFGTGFGPGAGDGESDPEDQDIPGLQIVTPFVINGLPGGVVNAAAGSTTFYDVTLELTESLDAVGAPDSLFAVYVVQELTGGQFRILSTDPVAGGVEDDYEVLLAGTIQTAAIAGILNSDTGAVLSATIDYTGGAIYDAALAHLGANDLTGSFSWSLLDIDAPLSITGGTLDDFEANGTGQFSGVPEPATLVLLLSGAFAVAARRRRRTT